MIYIYYSYLSEKNHDILLKNELSKFPIEFQNKNKRYIRWQDAQSTLLGRVLLLKGIKEIFNKDFQNQEIVYTDYDKPFFKDNLIHFNISHSGEIVVCAITDVVEIGIDVEIMTEIKIDDFKSHMTENEWNKIIFSDDKKEAFFNYWTQKEAVKKAHGHGLSIPLKSFEIIDNSVIINQEKMHVKEIKIHKQYKCHISQKESFSKIFMKEIQIY